MAKEISDGRNTVKLYSYKDRGRAMYQLAFYEAGKRKLRNFSVKSEAETTAWQILCQLTNGSREVQALRTPDLESLIAARRVLAPGFPLHVAVEEHAQAVGRLGGATLREAVDFFLRHNRSDVPRLMLPEVAEQFAASRRQAGCSDHYVSQCRKTVADLAKVFPGRTLPDLRTAELDRWLGGLPLGPKTKNGMRIILCSQCARRG